MKVLEQICFYLTRSRNDIFVIAKTNIFGIDGGRLVLGLFYIRAYSDFFFFFFFFVCLFFVVVVF